MPKLRAETQFNIEEKILDFLESTNGASIKQIADHMDLTTSAIYRHINKLDRERKIFKGVIKEPGVTVDVVTRHGYFLEP